MTSLLSKLSPVPTFPDYKGPYTVGTLELELPVAPLIDGGLSPPCPAHADISTLQMRMFYPARLKAEGESGGDGSANWVPSPRKEYVAAYCRFAGAGEWLANVLSYIPRHLYYTEIPALSGHKILQLDGEESKSRFPVVVFSHGLGGSRNTYSYMTASLASYGAVVFCLEHRDGSAPVTFIRKPTLNSKPSFSGLPSKNYSSTGRVDADGVPQTPSSSGSSDTEDVAQTDGTADPKEQTLDKDQMNGNPAATNSRSSRARRRIDYTFQPHEISDATTAIRHKQLEIRLWELGLAYAVIQQLQSGYPTTDLSHVHMSPKLKDKADAAGLLHMFQDKLSIDKPSSITWMGHSFGAATITQFVKSVWYHPELTRTNELPDPLYVPAEVLVKHFHPKGEPEAMGHGKAPATVLLDTWCLPLLGNRTRALWRRPLPGPVLGVLSWQFYKWKENLRGFRHVMNRTGGVFESAWFTDVERTERAAPDAVKNAALPQAQRLQRKASLDVTPQLPTGLSQADDAKIEEDTSEEEGETEEDNEGTSLRRIRSAASQKPVPGQPDRKLYYPVKSAHMSQSDFGVLFPRSARYFGGVDDSERVLDLNVRAVIQFMREQALLGVHMAPHGDGEEEIFGESGVQGWEAVDLELGEEGLPTEPAA